MLARPVTCYVGFDPTGSSFHVGSLVPIMRWRTSRRHGHRVIALIGGGTALIGDPSGKTEMRRLISAEDIDLNAVGLRAQLGRFLDFSSGGALMADNAAWLRPLNYIEFLREHRAAFQREPDARGGVLPDAPRERAQLHRVQLHAPPGVRFPRALPAPRLHAPARRERPVGNILAGADLIRRVEGAARPGAHLPLLATSSGAKMGKTEKGAVWLDGGRTSPYDYYQY